MPAEKGVTMAYSMTLSMLDSATLVRNKMFIPGAIVWQHATLGGAGTLPPLRVWTSVERCTKTMTTR